MREEQTREERKTKEKVEGSLERRRGRPSRSRTERRGRTERGWGGKELRE
jgi:hypothetical protein